VWLDRIVIGCLGLVDFDCTFLCAFLAKPDGMLPLWAIFGACSVSADFIMLICVLFSCPPLLAGELELFYFPYFFFSSRVVFMAGPKLATVP
jgi:hypothetical protein